MWITRRRAAELLECSTNTVDRLITIGDLQTRPAAPSRGGSLDQDQVVALAARRYEEREAITRNRVLREQRRVVPPDNDHEWLTASQAARVVRVTPMAIYKRVQRGTIPYTDHGGRHWFRHDHMKLLANSRSGPPLPVSVAELAARGLAARS